MRGDKQYGTHWRAAKPIHPVVQDQCPNSDE
jgi:hypothetical protein